MLAITLDMLTPRLSSKVTHTQLHHHITLKCELRLFLAVVPQATKHLVSMSENEATSPLRVSACLGLHVLGPLSVALEAVLHKPYLIVLVRAQHRDKVTRPDQVIIPCQWVPHQMIDNCTNCVKSNLRTWLCCYCDCNQSQAPLSRHTPLTMCHQASVYVVPMRAIVS